MSSRYNDYAVVPEANNTIRVYSPEGDVILPGNYSQNDWAKLHRANPDLTETLIRLRQARSDEINAQQSRRDTVALAGGGALGTVAFNRLGNAPYHNLLRKGLEKVQSTYIQPQSVISETEHSKLYAPAPGVVEYETLGQNIPISEPLEAKRNFESFTQTLEGQKLYRAVPTGTPDEIRKKASIYRRLGFTDTQQPVGDGIGTVMRLDKRPGASEFGGLYRQGDKIAHWVAQNPERASKIARYGGGAGLALAGAGLLRAGWGIINPLEDV
jgi:hypothetical protein